MLFLTTLAFAVPIPQSQFLRDRQGYLIYFDARTKNACWVYERLSGPIVQKKARDRFVEDLSIPLPFRTKNDDFRYSGFDRGHLCPFADLPEDSAKESCILSNISPQVPSFNRGLWLRLENYVRSLVGQYEELHIYTFPLYLPEPSTDGKRYVRYQVIGRSAIAVPTHFAKAIFAKGEDGVDVFAYLLPNREIRESIPLESYRTNLESLESLSGLLFPSPDSFP
jgi:endonuclease G